MQVSQYVALAYVCWLLHLFHTQCEKNVKLCLSVTNSTFEQK